MHLDLHVVEELEADVREHQHPAAPVASPRQLQLQRVNWEMLRLVLVDAHVAADPTIGERDL